jgi:alpha-glucosidase
LNPNSLYSFYRDMLAWRRGHALLRTGAIDLLPADDAVLAFVRRHADSSGAMLCAFNLSATEARYALPAEWCSAQFDLSLPLAPATLVGTTLVLPPCGAAFATL